MPFVQTESNYKPELLEKYKSFHLAHQYDSKFKVWVFKGYSCSKCGRIVQNPNIVPKHSQNCKGGKPTIYKQEPEPEQIVNVFGDVWQPFDVDTHESTKHSLK